MHGGGGARCRESIHSQGVYEDVSLQAAFHPKHSKLRPRSRKETRYI